MTDSPKTALNKLGFSADVTEPNRRGLFTVAIRTDKGWLYEKFKGLEDFTARGEAWAKQYRPEPS